MGYEITWCLRETEEHDDRDNAKNGLQHDWRWELNGRVGTRCGAVRDPVRIDDTDGNEPSLGSWTSGRSTYAAAARSTLISGTIGISAWVGGAFVHVG